MADRCRLCTTNDIEGLIDELAAEMWDSRRDRDMDPSWPDAPPYWHRAMREFAEATLKMLHRNG
jgi:hypothetical protein